MAQTAPMVTLENTGDIPQWVVMDNHEWVLPEYGVLDFPKGVANEFIAQRSRWVREYQPIKLPEPAPGEASMWIANMTGNPFLPAKVKDVRITRGKEEDIELDNPLRNPHTVKHTMQGGQVIQQCRRDPTASESINLPPTVVKVPPFRRFQVGMVLGDWLIRRDRQQHPLVKGQLQPVRGPRSYEAKQHWPIEDLQVYAKCIDRRRFTPDDEQFGELMTKQKKDYETEGEATQAAIDLWRAIWFRMLDERYGSVTEKDLIHFKRAKPVSAVQGEQRKKSLAERLGGGGAEAPA